MLERSICVRRWLCLFDNKCSTLGTGHSKLSYNWKGHLKKINKQKLIYLKTFSACVEVFSDPVLPSMCVFHPPIRSLMVSEPWLCSLLSVSRAACRLMHSFSRLSLLRSSRQHLSCSSRTFASSCCNCLLLSVWALRSLVAASDSARSSVLASSSWWRQWLKKNVWRSIRGLIWLLVGYSSLFSNVFVNSYSMLRVLYILTFRLSTLEKRKKENG